MGTMAPPVNPTKPSGANPGKQEQPSAWQKDIAVSLICPECRLTPANITEEFSSGDIICTDCGLVIGGRIIDTRSEWRTFSNDDQNGDDPSRVGDGPNALLNGSQLSTDIQFGAGGRAGGDLVRTQNKSNADKQTKQLLNAYKDIGELCDGWELPRQVTDLAKHLYKMVADGQSFKTKSQDVVIAGCIFIACRQSQVPRTFRETFALTKVSKKEIGKIFKALEKFFREQNATREQDALSRGQEIDTNSGYRQTETSNAMQLLSRYSSQLGLDRVTSNVALDVATKMNERGILAGRSPLSQCAASLYFSSHLMGAPKSSGEISKILGISDGTIRTVYKDLWKRKEDLVDPKWLAPLGAGNFNDLPAL